MMFSQYASLFSLLIVFSCAIAKCKACEAEADIVFVVDESQSITAPNFEKVKTFLASFVIAFKDEINDGKVRIGMLTFHVSTTDIFYLSNYTSSDDIIQAITSKQYVGGSTQTHAGISRMSNTYFDVAHGAREGLHHIGLVITDGVSFIPPATVSTASAAKADGITLYAIGITNMTNTYELANISSTPTSEYMFQADSFNSLSSIAPLIYSSLCRNIFGDESSGLNAGEIAGIAVGSTAGLAGLVTGGYCCAKFFAAKKRSKSDEKGEGETKIDPALINSK